MFFSKPTLDVDDEMRTWLDRSLLRLMEIFGREQFLKRPVILPTPQFFPDRYAPTKDALDKLVARVCGYMDVDFNRLDIHVYSENEHDKMERHFDSWESKSSGAAGLYYGTPDDAGKFQIGLARKNLHEPVVLIATIAHELGHVLLLGDGRISREEKDHEQLTDLLTVFMGLGIFTANAAFRFGQWQGDGKHGWQSSRLGYLSQSMFGYALAACAWMRRDEKAPWSSNLSPNVKDMFKKTMNYLTRNGETILAR